jgi:hypothetical protein
MSSMGDDPQLDALIFLMEWVSVKIDNDTQYDKAIDILNELKELQENS